MNGVKMEAVGKNYGQVEALQGISLDIHPGELFGLIGPDGAGKTTLFQYPDRLYCWQIKGRLPSVVWMSCVIIKRYVRWSVTCPAVSRCIRT